MAYKKKKMITNRSKLSKVGTAGSDNHKNLEKNHYKNEMYRFGFEGSLKMIVGVTSNKMSIYWFLVISLLLCIYSLVSINVIKSLDCFVPSTSKTVIMESNKGKLLPRVMYLSTDSSKYYNYVGHRAIKNETMGEQLMEDQFRNSRGLPLDDSACVPMKEWQTTLRPACNNMHEISMGHDVNALLGIGGWRLAWRIQKFIDGSEDLIVLKTLNTRTTFDDVTFYQHFVDAAVSDHLSSSKYTLDVYGFCGQSILNEFASTTLEDLILNYKKNNDYHSIPPIQKAVIAREISFALEELHGVDGNATIVYKDFKPANVFVMKDGSVKLGDFNLSELLSWNVTSNRQCVFRRRKNNAVSYRSPEEAREESLTEKIDIYSLGSILFKVITGATPYYQTNQLDEKFATTKLAQKLLMENQMPMLPSRYSRINDKILLKMMDIMHECHTLNEDMRPSASDVAKKMMALTKGEDKKIMFGIE